MMYNNNISLTFVISILLPPILAYLQVYIPILTFPLYLPLSDGGHFGNMQIRRSKRGQIPLPYIRIRKGYIGGHLCQIS